MWDLGDVSTGGSSGLPTSIYGIIQGDAGGPLAAADNALADFTCQAAYVGETLAIMLPNGLAAGETLQVSVLVNGGSGLSNLDGPVAAGRWIDSELNLDDPESVDGPTACTAAYGISGHTPDGSTVEVCYSSSRLVDTWSLDHEDLTGAWSQNHKVGVKFDGGTLDVMFPNGIEAGQSIDLGYGGGNAFVTDTTVDGPQDAGVWIPLAIDPFPGRSEMIRSVVENSEFQLYQLVHRGDEQSIVLVGSDPTTVEVAVADGDSVAMWWDAVAGDWGTGGQFQVETSEDGDTWSDPFEVDTDGVEAPVDVFGLNTLQSYSPTTFIRVTYLGGTRAPIYVFAAPMNPPFDFSWRVADATMPVVKITFEKDGVPFQPTPGTDPFQCDVRTHYEYDDSPA